MLKKFTYAATISALAAFSLVAIAGAAGNDYANFTIANGDPNEEGTTRQVKVQHSVTVGNEPSMLNIGAGDDGDKPTVSFSAADHANFTIANGDPNEEGTVGQPKVQPAVIVGNEPTKLNIGAGDDNDKPTVSFSAADYANFSIANGDPNEEGTVGQPKVQPAVTVGSEPTVSGNSVKLNIGASDPAEQ